MKRNFTLFVSLFLVTASLYAQPLTKEEKKSILTLLKDSQSELLKTVKGLSEQQLNYKPSADEWSIAECVEHLAVAESGIFSMVETALEDKTYPEKRGEVAMSDEQLLAVVVSREQKVKTRKESEPTNRFGSYEASVEAFKEKRKSNMKFLKSTDEDLRNRYANFPFGLADTYQAVLVIAGHTTRHTDQIKEILKNSDFPNS